MWDAPGATSHPAFEYDARNPLGRVSPLLVSHAARRVGEDWFQVYLPLRPNGSTAWVRARDIRLRRATEHLEVDVSKRTMWRYDGDRVVDRFRVGVGTDATPTATGTFFVWVKVHYADGASPYGPMALGLSGFSRVLSYWRGGGRMAIHGTADPSDRGHAVSNGCVRVYDPDLRRLADVPLGTPVVIHA
jgi:hypothetical protein